MSSNGAAIAARRCRSSTANRRPRPSAAVFALLWRRLRRSRRRGGPAARVLAEARCAHGIRGQAPQFGALRGRRNAPGSALLALMANSVTGRRFQPLRWPGGAERDRLRAHERFAARRANVSWGPGAAVWRVGPGGGTRGIDAGGPQAPLESPPSGSVHGAIGSALSS